MQPQPTVGGRTFNVRQTHHNAAVTSFAMRQVVRTEHLQRVALLKGGAMPGLNHIHNELQWRRYLKAQYGHVWKVHFAKKSNGAWRSVKYPGRYQKYNDINTAIY